jgi:hypothetical protein
MARTCASKLSRNVGHNEVQQLPRVYNPRVLPSGGEVPLVAGNQILGTSSFRALQKFVIGGIDAHGKCALRPYDPGLLADELQGSNNHSSWQSEFGTVRTEAYSSRISSVRKNRPPIQCQIKDVAFQTVHIQMSGYDNVSVKHYAWAWHCLPVPCEQPQSPGRSLSSKPH